MQLDLLHYVAAKQPGVPEYTNATLIFVFLLNRLPHLQIFSRFQPEVQAQVRDAAAIRVQSSYRRCLAQKLV